MSKLIDLIKENPNMPIFFGIENASQYIDDLIYLRLDTENVDIKELTFYNGQWLEFDSFKEKLHLDLESDDEYCEMSDDEFVSVFAEKLGEAEFRKAIVVYEE